MYFGGKYRIMPSYAVSLTCLWLKLHISNVFFCSMNEAFIV